ncbi:MAG: hypothetical protein HKN45_08925 [Flavobacteriales bacterium]|nr:hypothetical protein [Flavobacteriales bacterium]
MLTVYCDHITIRLRYTLEVIFEEILSCPITISQDKKSLGKGPCLNYSNELLEGVPYIKPHSLIFENGIRILAEKIDNSGMLFPTESDLIEQDTLALVFFLVSRYEEYLDDDRDEFGRIKATNSQLYQAGLLHTPLVDKKVIELYNSLRSRYPTLPPLKRQFQVIPTFDIDVAYAFKGRGWLRRTRSTFKDVLTFEWKRIKRRKLVLHEELVDDFDTYSYQQRICQQAGTRPRHFFLLGNYGKYDKNLSHKQPLLRTLINDISTWSDIGIHPSMRSNDSIRILRKEIKRLKKIASLPVQRSRQHFLYLELPNTYQNLIEIGILEDYSMGYADRTGFRAGICSPYKWYDLEKEEMTDLYIFPTQVMDSTLRDYQKLSLEEAKQEMLKLRSTIEQVNGTMIILWHNHSATRKGEWEGWRGVLEAGLFG